jgi:hypothetical protein
MREVSHVINGTELKAGAQILTGFLQPNLVEEKISNLKSCSAT